jgi:hypothetical protein
VAADPVAALDGASAIAAAIAAYERQGERLGPAAALVHGSGDRSLAAVISLVKLEIPVARVAESAGETPRVDLAALLADHTISRDASLPEQVRSWLRRVLVA